MTLKRDNFLMRLRFLVVRKDLGLRSPKGKRSYAELELSNLLIVEEIAWKLRSKSR